MYLDDVAARIKAAVPLGDRPSGDTSALYRMYAVLAFACGTAVTAEDVHNVWVAWMAEQDPSHEALVPYAQLSREVSSEDIPYVDAIRSVAGQLIRVSEIEQK